MVSNIRLLHPDFEYVFYDDAAVERFIEQEFPQYWTIFNSFPFRIQRYDFFRYLVVYRYGGFYFDLDVLLASDVSELLTRECVFPFEGLTFSHYLRTQCHMDWEIGNYAFGAAPGHPFLEKVISNCVRAQEEPEWARPMMRGLPVLSRPNYIVLNKTGPGLISRTLAENPELARSVTILFPKDVCNSHGWNCFGEYGIHLMEGSWRPGGALRRRIAGYLELWRLKSLQNQSRKLGPVRALMPGKSGGITKTEPNVQAPTVPLVSILIPAYNAEEWIASTLNSALAQTWPRTEIIVVDDGSKDATLTIARQYESRGVRVFTQKNQGASAARNNAFSKSHGDYIQWLDADDLLARDKISKQMEFVMAGLSRQTLLSSPWGRFMYRHSRAQFKPTSLWCDLTPQEWLLRKMDQNIYMQTASWLVSRELTEAAGPWDIRLLGDDDGEYFCRVLLASNGVRFVHGANVYYRAFRFDSLSFIGRFPRKIEAHWISMQLHIKYLRSLGDDARARAACLQYLRDALIYFYPERSNILAEANALATELGGTLGTPFLSWRYSWLKVLFGWVAVKPAQSFVRKIRWGLATKLDYLLYRLEERKGTAFTQFPAAGNAAGEVTGRLH
jgi:glycosyltransferase involved in cell wall biosynthesis